MISTDVPPREVVVSFGMDMQEDDGRTIARPLQPDSPLLLTSPLPLLPYGRATHRSFFVFFRHLKVRVYWSTPNASFVTSERPTNPTTTKRTCISRRRAVCALMVTVLVAGGA
jgi:hypothetical protein